MTRLFVDWSCTHTHAATAGGAYSVDDWRCYVWAWLAVNTRCIHLGQDIGSRDTIALAPFLDLLNHGKEAKVTTYFDLISRQFVIKTLTPYKRGREVFISYGPHDNSFMLAEYGFVIAENPFQTLELDHQVYAWIAAVKSRLRPATPGKPATVQPSDIDEMIRTLKRHGLWGDFALSPEDRDIPYRLQAALRLLISHAAVHQQGIYSKGAIVRWERWRRGEPDYSNNDPDNNDCAIRNWVKITCQTIADTSAKMISNIDAYRCAQDMKQCYNVAFPAQCLCTIWKEIDVIARSFTEI
ncbi:hypothetical protein EV175_002858 [Coemansia sp. RSA 1933]|nr:hypothetical protein EV175_002858 [Coemansia sp. RSA 1933]